MKNIVLLTILICTTSQLTIAQDISLTIKQVSETRHTSDTKNTLSVIVGIDSLRLDDKHLVRVKESIAAVDNTGVKLKPVTGYPYGGYFQQDYELNIGFESPGRQATEIQKVKGVLEYYTISEEKKSKVTLSNFKDHTYENLLTGTTPNVKLIFIDLDSIKKVNSTELYYEELKRIHKEIEIGQTLEEADNFFRDILYFQNQDPSPDIYFYQEDPNQTIHKITVYNGEGTKMNTEYSQYQNTYRIGLSEQPLADWTLEIHIKSKESIQEFPIEFNNIKLP